MSIQLIPLATAVLTLGDAAVITNVPGGTRSIVDITEANWSGARIKARLKSPAAADWAFITNDGVIAVDVRTTLETEDGALIYVSYLGRASVNGADGAVAWVTPLFQTGDSRYTWLNGIQAVARGTAVGRTLTYEVYEMN